MSGRAAFILAARRRAAALDAEAALAGPPTLASVSKAARPEGRGRARADVDAAGSGDLLAGVPRRALGVAAAHIAAETSTTRAHHADLVLAVELGPAGFSRSTEAEGNAAHLPLAVSRPLPEADEAAALIVRAAGALASVTPDVAQPTLARAAATPAGLPGGRVEGIAWGEDGRRHAGARAAAREAAEADGALALGATQDAAKSVRLAGDRHAVAEGREAVGVYGAGIPQAPLAGCRSNLTLERERVTRSARRAAGVATVDGRGRAETRLVDASLSRGTAEIPTVRAVTPAAHAPLADHAVPVFAAVKLAAVLATVLAGGAVAVEPALALGVGLGSSPINGDLGCIDGGVRDAPRSIKGGELAGGIRERAPVAADDRAVPRQQGSVRAPPVATREAKSEEQRHGPDESPHRPSANWRRNSRAP